MGSRTGAVSPAAAIQPQPGLPTDVSSNDGEVMGAPQLFAIYFGNTYGDDSTGLNQAAKDLNGFLAGLASSNYFDLCAEYNVAKPQFLGSAWVGTGGTPVTMSGDEVRDNLISILDEPASPVTVRPDFNNTNLLYVLFVDPFTSVTLPDGKSGGPNSNNSFCAYHTWAWYHKDILGIPEGKANLFYAVILYPQYGNSTTVAVTHELVEAFTDRSGNGWRTPKDPSGHFEEIGDICNSCSNGIIYTATGEAVASYWLAGQGRCLQQSDLTPVVVVPNVVGMQPDEAGNTLKALSLTVSFMNRKAPVERPVVVAQSPGANANVAIGALITLTVDIPDGIQR
jgi:hypothetical protein